MENSSKPKKTVFLFAGQGSQKQGMGKDFYDSFPSFRRSFQLMNASSPWPLEKLCFETEQKQLNRTSLCQPALAGYELALARLLEENGITADYAIGLSLGEYSALAYAGALPLEDLCRITARRGELMEKALPEGTGSMMAVFSEDQKQIVNICRDLCEEGLICEPANWNSPVQLVLSGSPEGLAEAKKRLRAAGIRKAIPLKVSGPFHSSFLKEASEDLRNVLNEQEIGSLQFPVVFNVTGKDENPKTADELRDLLVRQLYSPVLFDQGLDRLIELGADTFIEIGPGNVLSRLVSQKMPDARVYSLETPEDLERLKGEWNA